MVRRLGSVRTAALVAHAAYVVALLVAAFMIYRVGQQAPNGPGADWAAFDAVLTPIFAVAIAGFAAIHALVAIAWIGGARTRWVLATTLPVAALVMWVWASAGWASLLGWPLVLFAILAAALSSVAGARWRSEQSGTLPPRGASV